MSEPQGELNSASNPGGGGIPPGTPGSVEFRQCPECLMPIPTAANRCAHCGHRQGNAMKVNTIGAIVLVAVILLAGWWVISSYNSFLP